MRLLILTLAILTTPVYAGNFGANLQFFQAENGQTTLIPDYYWSAGKLSGYGYHDRYWDGGIDYFANHGVEYDASKSLFLGAEFGFTSFGKNQKYGAGLRLASFPKLEKSFDYLNVIYYGHVTGEDAEQVKVVWGTSRFNLTEKVSVYSDGFLRVRHGLPNAGHAKFWMKVDGVPIEFGVAAEMFDNKYNPQLALRYYF